MSYRFLYIVILFFSSAVFAQDNLVPNYSFENYSACPTGADELSNTTDWYAANKEIPDYFNSCQLLSSTYGVPFTIHGYQPARTGGAYIGLQVYGAVPDRREYIQVQLSSSLKQDTDYLIEFYVNLANNSSLAITEIGAYLSSNPVNDTSAATLPYSPQVVSANSAFLSDTANWIKVSGTYTALGGERFITIGNFKDDSATDTLRVSASPSFSYYFVEDVRVVQSDSSAEAANIFTPNEDGINDDWIIRNLPKNSLIKIYDRWGVQVGGVEGSNGIQGTYKWDGRTTSGERCKNGIYFYVVSSDTDGNIKSQKGFIQLIR